MTDSLDRYHGVRDDISANSRWVIGLSRFQDQHHREPTTEEAREIAAAAGVVSAADTAAATEPPPLPGDGGSRGAGVPPTTETQRINRRIAEAERAGDVEAAMAAKRELLELLNRELNPAN